MRNLLLFLFVAFSYFGLKASAGDSSSEDAALSNLNDTLKNAQAVPYVDPATGKIKGYFVESNKSEKDFRELKIRQGDSLTVANELPNETAEQNQ